MECWAIKGRMSFPLDLKAPHNITILFPLVLALTFRPDGVQLAVASLDAQITFWDIARRVLFLLRSVLRNTQGSCVYWFRGVGEYLVCVTVNRLIVVSRGRKKRIFELSGSAIPSLAAFLVPRIGVLYSSGLQSSGRV